MSLKYVKEIIFVVNDFFIIYIEKSVIIGI